MQTIPLAVQLYTLRDLVTKDFAATVRDVAGLGYSGVEMAGYGNLKTADEAKRACDDAGLRIVAVHAPIEKLESEFSSVADEQHALNCATVVCPWMPEQRRKDADGWMQTAAALNQIGGKCREGGLEFCYHHHSFEFATFDGRTGMDILLDHTEPSLVKIEPDVYWLRHGGQDPVAFIRRLGARAPLVHLKDMAAGPEQRFAPVGTGVIDFRAILSTMGEICARWGIVEQDQCYDAPPLDAVRTSLEKLRAMQ